MDYKIIFGESLELIQSMNKSYKYYLIGLNERYQIIFTNDKFRKEYYYVIEGSSRFLRNQLSDIDNLEQFRRKQNEKKEQNDNIPYYAFNCNFIF